MPDKERRHPKRFRPWPGAVFPLGLTLLLGLAAWQFATSVRTEQERRDSASLALAAYAKMEAGELARRAFSLAHSLTANRLAARAEQEKNLHIEIRGLMEAVNRVLGASLDRNRAQNAGRREIPSFPSGFESVRKYLELSRADAKTDLSVKALHACAPELGALLPAGCSLAVIENNAVEIFSIGGGAPPEDSVSVAMSREFVWSEGSAGGRRWTILLKLHAPDRHPFPEAGEIAGHLSREMAGIRLDNAVWRGWLVGADGQPAAAFPAAPAGAAAGGEAGREPPPFTGMPGEWVEIDGRWLVWLESATPAPGAAVQAGAAGQTLVPAAAVSIARPAPPLEPVSEFLGDARWICTLGALALGAAAFWIWFLRSAFRPRRRVAEEESGEEAESVRARSRRRAGEVPPSAGADAVAAELRRRLVRGDAARPVADVEDVIVADIGPGGEMSVSGARDFSAALRHAAAVPRRPAPPLPSGSLARLQARHRGGKGRAGSRALDRATNPVLKMLAARVRPVVPPPPAPPQPQEQPPPPSRPCGRETERLTKP